MIIYSNELKLITTNRQYGMTDRAVPLATQGGAAAKRVKTSARY